jgi:mono/diheme cytochrome c family protein
MKSLSQRSRSFAVGLIISFVSGVLVLTVMAVESSEEWKAPERASRKKNPISADAASIAKGKTLYVKECLSCHGPAGKGDGPAAKDLEKSPGDLSSPKMKQQTDGSLFWKITEGKKPMPSYEKIFTEEQRWQVVNYIRTLTPQTGGSDPKPGKSGGR